MVETQDTIYLIETKALKEMDNGEVQEKAKVTMKYCNYATEFTAEYGGKAWKVRLNSAR